jgi:protein phosphatase methylesterase 1
MSDFQRSFAKARLAELPPDAPDDDSALQDHGTELQPDLLDDDSSSASSASSAGTIKPVPSRNLFARPMGWVKKRLSR